MTALHFRQPLVAIAASIAVLSFVAVGAVVAMAFNGAVAPAWVTSAALYGLPLAFLLMLFRVISDAAARRRPPAPSDG